MGVYKDAIGIPSPNKGLGRHGFRAEAIVIHIMEGSLAGTDSWFRDPASQVSAHYGVGKEGVIHNYVDEDDTAWHAGRVSMPSWPLIKNGTNGSYINPNLYTVGIEHEGDADTEWTDDMYRASSRLVKDICERNGIAIDRLHILGHHEIYSLKSCPGYKLDLDKLVQLCNDVPVTSTNVTKSIGAVVSNCRLRIRAGHPSVTAPVTTIVPLGSLLEYSGIVIGDKVEGNNKWYTDGANSYWWSGGVSIR